jgi:hypothetical protein
MFNINGKVIRICLTCGVIYTEKAGNLTYIKPCKSCESATGFFESTDHFYKYVDLYGIDLDLVRDKELQLEIEVKYS